MSVCLPVYVCLRVRVRVFCVYTYVCFVLYRFVAAEPDSILLRFDIRAPRSRRIIFQGGSRGDSLSPSSAFENKKGRTRASSCFSLSINFLFFLYSFLSSFVVRPRSGTAVVVVSQCVRKKCHVVLFFSSGKEGQILVYLEFILGSLSFSDAQVLYASAIFDLLSSVTLFLFLTFFCPFLFLFPLLLSCVFIYFLTASLFSLSSFSLYISLSFILHS